MIVMILRSVYSVVLLQLSLETDFQSHPKSNIFLPVQYLRTYLSRFHSRFLQNDLLNTGQGVM